MGCLSQKIKLMKRKLFLGIILGSLTVAHAQKTYSITSNLEDVLAGPATLPYQFGFESALTVEEWTTVSPSGEWSIFTNDPDLPAHQGQGVAGLYGGMDPLDSWLFSRGIELESGQQIDISYFMAKKAIWATGGIHSYKVSIGTSATVAGQTTELAAFTNVSNMAYMQKTHQFTAPADGIYYIGFHNESPAHAADNYGALIIDDFSVTDVTAGMKDNELVGLEISPNPSNDFVVISTQSAIITNATIADMNGRIVRNYKVSNLNSTSISISDLSPGIYLLTISSDKGIATKKIIKK